MGSNVSAKKLANFSLDKSHYRGKDDIASELLCFSCKKIFVLPHQCRECGEIICGQCTLKKPEPQSPNHPGCNGTSFKEPNSLIVKQLMESMFACPACAKVMTLLELQSTHWEKEHTKIVQISETKKDGNSQKVFDEKVQDLKDDLKEKNEICQNLRNQLQNKDQNHREELEKLQNNIQSLRNSNQELKEQLVSLKKNSGSAPSQAKTEAELKEKILKEI